MQLRYLLSAVNRSFDAPVMLLLSFSAQRKLYLIKGSRPSCRRTTKNTSAGYLRGRRQLSIIIGAENVGVAELADAYV